MDLEKHRKDQGLSQKQLSDKSGVSQTYISELEAHKKQPTIPIVKKLAKALNKTVSDLLEDDEIQPTGT